MILVSSITFFRERCVLICDAACDKAFGINGRPRQQLGDDEDDYELLADNEVGIAPADPGTYEGSSAKPTDYTDPTRHNKWCARECERSRILHGNGSYVELHDWQKRKRNMTP